MEHYFKWRVVLCPEKGHMTNIPEQKPQKHRPQIFDDEDRMKAAMASLKKENHSLKELVIQLSMLVIRKVTGKT